MKTTDNPPPHKLGANRHDPAHKRHVARNPTAESRDVREDRSTRQSKLTAHVPPDVSGGGEVRLLARDKKPRRARSVSKATVGLSSRKPVKFHLRHDAAQSVSVAGSFNDWDPDRHPLVRTEAGDWTLELMIEPGRHEYLFVADGCWLPDPNAVDWVENPYGGHNSVIAL